MSTPQAAAVTANYRNPILSNLVAYGELKKQMPVQGRHINASFSRKSEDIAKCIAAAAPSVPDAAKKSATDTGIIVVYQAFNKQIAAHAAQHQTFLGCDSYNPTRMTWIKTSYCWMMFRCEFCTRDVNQERVVGITLPIAAFDEILALSWPTTKKKQRGCPPGVPVRLQWDPDHSPRGGKLERRAIQLGIRGEALELFHNSIMCIDDITDTIVAPYRPARFCRGTPFRLSDWPPKGAPVGSAADDPLLGDEAKWKKQEKKAADAAIMQPLEELYVPSSAALADHIRLTVMDQTSL